MTIDFEKDQTEVLDKTTNINKLADKIKELQAQQEQLQIQEDAVKQKKKDIEYLSGEVIPTMLSEMGLSFLKLQDGSTTDNFSQPCILQKSANGLYASWDIIYPIDSVIFSYVNVNPTDAGGSLEGSGQIWSAAGTVATAGTGAATIYAFKRDS